MGKASEDLPDLPHHATKKL